MEFARVNKIIGAKTNYMNNYFRIQMHTYIMVVERYTLIIVPNLNAYKKKSSKHSILNTCMLKILRRIKNMEIYLDIIKKEVLSWTFIADVTH